MKKHEVFAKLNEISPDEEKTAGGQKDSKLEVQTRKPSVHVSQASMTQQSNPSLFHTGQAKKKPTLKMSNKSLTESVALEPVPQLAQMNQTSTVKFHEANGPQDQKVLSGRTSQISNSRSIKRTKLVFNGTDEPRNSKNADKVSRKHSKSGKSKKTDKRSTRKFDERSNRSKSMKAKPPDQKVVPTKLGAALEDGKSDSIEMSSYGDESDDYVGIDNFKEYKAEMEQIYKSQNNKIKELKGIIEESLDHNIDLLSKVQQVDWDVIRDAEVSVSTTLQEFQQTIDALCR